MEVKRLAMAAVLGRKTEATATWAVYRLLLSLGVLLIGSGLRGLTAMAGQPQLLVRLLVGVALVIVGIELSSKAR
jgi:hypothetical protein